MSEENKPKDTRTEFERMVDGEPYHYSEPSVKNRAIEGAEGCKKLNSLDGEEKRAFMREYFTCKPDANFWVSSPFFCEYGSNIHMGTAGYIGPGCTFLDVTTITIGDRTLFGPNVSLYTPVHPINPEKRNGAKGAEWARPIKVGNDCWIGGSVVILGGVSIGDGCTIGAGAVVTKNVPPRQFWAGNPAKFIKNVDEMEDAYGPKP